MIGRTAAIVLSVVFFASSCSNVFALSYKATSSNQSRNGPPQLGRQSLNIAGAVTPHETESSTDRSTRKTSVKSHLISRASFLSFAAAGLLTTSLASPSDATVPSDLKHELNNEKSVPDTHKVCTFCTSSEVLADKKGSSETLEESISGFVSGAALAATKTVVKYPLDTATVRLQMPGTAYSLFDLSALFQGSFRGISGPLLSNIPAGAVFFAVKDAAKAALKENGASRWVATSLAVAAALPPYWLVRNPSEVVKTRQQANIEGYGEGISLLDAFNLAMSKNETGGVGNIGELYTGYWENLLYTLPADVIKFLCYDSLTGGRKDLPPIRGAAYGALSTAVAQLITTPLDVVRNRVMAGENPSSGSAEEESQSGGRCPPREAPKLSYLDSFKDIAEAEGLSALFSGASPRVGKAILSGAIQFATYEETKQSLNRLFLKANQ